jgi:hypothetical protein
MRITLRSVGGFTGPAGASTRTVDVGSLPPAAAGHIRSLVDASGFFGLPDKVAKKAPQPWDFTHHLEVDDGGRRHAVQFHEDAASPELRSLLAAVKDAPAATAS